MWGGVYGGASGAVGAAALYGLAKGLDFVCFVAGTQVLIEEEELADTDSSNSAAAQADSAVAVVAKTRYITKAIDELVACGGGEMGSGGGQYLLARDQNDPDGPLVRCRIVRTYRRIAYHLQVLTLRDADGQEQTQRVTDEHPYRHEDDGWTAARKLEVGHRVRGRHGMLEVVANVGEAHPEGVAVYNLEVEHAHTYFVRAEGSDAEPVWVHNAEYDKPWYEARLKSADPSAMAELNARMATDRTVAAGEVRALLQADGEILYGRNAWAKDLSNPNKAYEFAQEVLDTNLYTARHAEGDVFLQAYAAERSWQGVDAVLSVSEKLCSGCRRLDGVFTTARRLGFRSLEVVTPQGTTGRVVF